MVFGFNALFQNGFHPFPLIKWDGRGGARTPLLPDLTTGKGWLMTDSSRPKRTFEFVVEIQCADRAQALAVMGSMRADVPLGVKVSCDYMGELQPGGEA